MKPFKSNSITLYISKLYYMYETIMVKSDCLSSIIEGRRLDDVIFGKMGNNVNVMSKPSISEIYSVMRIGDNTKY